MIWEYVICYGGEMLRALELIAQIMGYMVMLFCVFSIIGIWADSRNKKHGLDEYNKSRGNRHVKR